MRKCIDCDKQVPDDIEICSSCYRKFEKRWKAKQEAQVQEAVFIGAWIGLMAWELFVLEPPGLLTPITIAGIITVYFYREDLK